MHFISRAVPEGAAGTAQALYATSAAGVLMGAVTLASGPLYAASGGSVYGLPALMAAAGVILTLWLGQRWTGDMLWEKQPALGSRLLTPTTR
jgi:PPP family 3-phenylpropionic acid transporter